MASALWLLFSGFIIGWVVSFALSGGMFTWALLCAAVAILAITVYHARGTLHSAREAVRVRASSAR